MPPRHKVRLTAWARICECLGLLDSGKTYGSEHTQLAGKCVGNTETEIYFIDKIHLSNEGSKLINVDLIKIIDKIY